MLQKNNYKSALTKAMTMGQKAMDKVVSCCCYNTKKLYSYIAP